MMTNPDHEEIASREEVLALLSSAARRGHVGAARLLLKALREDQADDAEPADADEAEPATTIDLLARRRP